MIVRAATPDDVPDIAAIEAVVDPRAWSVAQVRSHLAHPRGQSWVASSPPAVVAHVLARVVADEVEIVTVATHPDHRRRGVARALLGELLDRWRAQGCAKVFLEVRTDNAAGLALYADLGFAPVGRRSRYYRDGCDAVVMARELTSPSA